MPRPNELEQITNPDSHSFDNSFESHSKSEGNIDVSGNALNSPEGHRLDFQVGVVEMGGTAISMASENENSETSNPSMAFKARSEREEVPEMTEEERAARSRQRVEGSIIDPKSKKMEEISRSKRRDGGYTPPIEGTREEDYDKLFEKPAQEPAKKPDVSKVFSANRDTQRKSKQKLEEIGQKAA